MRWLAVAFAALSLSGLAGAAGAAAVPPFPRLPGTWSHAEINVTLNKKPHTLSLDRGKITKVSGTQLTLREKTGGVVTVVTVPLSASAIVTIDGFRSTIYSLRREAERSDDADRRRPRRPHPCDDLSTLPRCGGNRAPRRGRALGRRARPRAT